MSKKSPAQEMARLQEVMALLNGKDVSEELLKKFSEEETIYFDKSLYEGLLTQKFNLSKKINNLSSKMEKLEEEFISIYAEQGDSDDTFDSDIESESILDEDKDDLEFASEETISFNKVGLLNKLRTYRSLKFQIEIEKEALKKISEVINSIQHKI